MGNSGQPLQVVFAPAILSIPEGCPPGLEHLVFADNLYLKQKVELLEVMTGISTENRYHILNAQQQQLYEAKENSNFCIRMCTGALRPFKMTIYDNSGRGLIEIDRPYKFSSAWMPCCLPLNSCFLQTMHITSPLTGQVFGRIRQNYELCAASFTLEDEHGNVIGKMKSPLLFCECCTSDIDFPIETNGQELARVSHKWGGFLKEFYTNADDYHIQFPLNLPVSQKVVMIAAAILIDYVFFERKNDNNN